MTKEQFEGYAASRIADAQKRTQWLLDHWDALNVAGVKVSSWDPFNYSTIDIDRPTREQVLAVIKAIPGKWEKEKGGLPTTINYLLKVDGYTVRLWAAPPPPSCRMIEEEVGIPAQPARKEKRMRLECKPEEVEV